MNQDSRQARRAMARAEEAQRHNFSELGQPGPPAEETPKWEMRLRPRRAVFLGTVADRVDLYILPRLFPMDATLLRVDGPGLENTEMTPVKRACQQHYAYWQVAMFRAIQRGLLQPWECQPNSEAAEREQDFRDMPYRAYRIPECAGDRWDPEIHGVEVTEDEAATTVSWKPGEYRFEGSDRPWTIQVPGERGSVPAAEPDQQVLEAMHGFLAAVRDKL